MLYHQNFKSNDLYIEYLCQHVIPQIAKLKLADAIDIYCENIAFNLNQAEHIFATAKKHNLAIKCHAEQFSDLGISSLAAKYGALSVDHLEFISENSIKAIKAAQTIAVLLPTAYYFLKQQKKPPIDLFRKYQVPMAVASDCNPGTSPCTSILLCLNMACTLFGLSINEAILGVTINAARALGKAHEIGSMEVNKKAHLAVWDINHPAELCYYLGHNPLYKLIKDKEIIVSRETPLF